MKLCNVLRYILSFQLQFILSAIKTGRYTHELRSKNIMEVKQLQQQRERGTTAPVSEPLLPQIKVPEGAIKTTTPCSPELNEELQDTLDKLMMAQTYLFEFLDDYYDSDLILKRQIEVYVSNIYLSIYLSIYQSILSYLIYMSICLSIGPASSVGCACRAG